MRRGIDDLLVLLTGEQSLQPHALAKADKALAALIETRGYSRESARDAIISLRRLRHAD